MRKAHHVQQVTFSNGHMAIKVDGKEHSVDLKDISKRLLRASKKERESYEISPAGYGIHWPLIDEDLSIDALIGVKHKSSQYSRA